MIHADDAGLSWAENKATQIGMTKGSINSTSLMVPCPWYYEMAKFCLSNPKLDYGIHLTLTGEWKNYPFKPCANPNKVKSLINEYGYFHPKRDLIKKNAKAEEVYIELKTQIEIALKMGLNPSHLDSHMYTLGLRQDLIDVYIKLGEEYKLPIFLSKKLIKLVGEDPNIFVFPESKCFESIFMGSYDIFQSKGLFNFYDDVIDELDEGISFVLIHPGLKSDEMDQITLDHPNFGSNWRSKDYKYFTSERCKRKLKENSIELINWKSPVILNYLGA